MIIIIVLYTVPAAGIQNPVPAVYNRKPKSKHNADT